MYKSYYIKLYLALALIALPLVFIYSQSTNPQVKRLKRAIFIYNFAEQVQFKDTNTNPEFRIGVLGRDRTIIDLRALSQKRKIKQKPVQVVAFNSVKDITDVDVIYVNHNKNFDVDYILNKISGNNTLLVTEDYPYNTSMINIVNVGDSFEYEINETIMASHNILAPLSLRQHAITSVERWKQLYQNSEAELQNTETKLSDAEDSLKEKDTIISQQDRELQTQQSTIVDKDKELDSKNNTIKQRDVKIQDLVDINEFQQKKYAEKLVIERQLEQRITAQIDSLQAQQIALETSESKIAKQTKILQEQNKEIATNQDKISNINKALNTQRTINYLLLALITLAIISAFLLYRNYRAIKALNANLQAKNDAIYNQSLVLASKNRELEEFAYITSHDLKEPLTTISGLISLLKDDYKDKLDEDGLTSMQFISESSIRMRVLIDSLLEYSRLGKSKSQTNVDCDVLVDDIKSDLSNIISRNNAKVTAHNLPTVAASEVELRTLFQNLINNAIKFKKPHIDPIVKVSCTTVVPEHQNKPFWQFEIADNGIGIAEKHQDKIFSIFQRLHTREEYEGTGIGLAYCKKIVEALGGQIWLDSTVGEGTTFYFTVPKL